MPAAQQPASGHFERLAAYLGKAVTSGPAPPAPAKQEHSNRLKCGLLITAGKGTVQAQSATAAVGAQLWSYDTEKGTALI